jgi:hypothetical protein
MSAHLGRPSLLRATRHHPSTGPMIIGPDLGSAKVGMVCGLQ